MLFFPVAVGYHFTCNQDLIVHISHVDIHLIRRMKQVHGHISSCTCYHKHKYILVLINICGDVTLTSFHRLIFDLSMNPHILLSSQPISLNIPPNIFILQMHI